MTDSIPSRQILTILAPGAEEIETMTVPDLLARAGHQVTVASLTDVPMVRGSRGLPLAAHATLDQLPHQVWDLIYLPGGLGSARACRDDPRVQDLAEQQLAAQRWLAVICAAPIALVPRHLAQDRRVTSFPGVRGDVEPHVKAWLDAPVVIDGPLVTSQSAATAMSLGLVLVSLLGTPAQARTIAQAILAPLPAIIP